MNHNLIGGHPWRAVVEETSRYWLRRHTSLVLLIVAGIGLAGLALLGRASYAQNVLAGVAFYAPLVAGLVALSGIVSDERASTLILLWFQKPGTLLRAYVLRYFLYQAILLTLVLLTALLLGTLGVAADIIDGAKAVRLAGMMAALAALPAAMVFAFSAWGAQRDSTATFIAIILSLGVAGALAFNQSPGARTLKAIVFPFDPMFALSGNRAYDPDVTRAALIILAQWVAWTAVGFAGLKYTERSLQRGD